MQNELAEIIDRLEKLKAKVQSLGEEREKLVDSIAEAETHLETAREQLKVAAKPIRDDKD
ncbi:MAG TPA: hypothetical protein PK867_21630 [Pirellulales bacterium]|nr:hypothetical protein [Pirellulales bacterium]